MHGGTSTADRGQFVEAAGFVCTLLGPAPLGVMVLLATGHCVATNATLNALSRQTTLHAELLGGVPIHFGTAELAAAFAQALRGEMAIVDTESPPVLGPGQGLWRLRFMPFAVGGERGAALLFEDMPAHQLATEAYHAAEQRFRLLVDSAADGIIIYRAQILLYVNPEAVRLFGFQSPDELVGRPIIDLVVSEDRPSFDLRLGGVEAGSGSGLFKTAFVRRDGTSFSVECRTSRARVDEMGAESLFFRDITERLRLQARRENAQRIDTLARLSVSMGTELQGYAADLRRWLARSKSGGLLAEDNVSELVNLAESMAARADAFSLVPQPSSEPEAPATLEDLLARVCTSFTQQKSSTIRGQDTHPPWAPSHELLVDLEPVPYAVRGDARSIEAGLAVLARVALRARVNNSPLCIRGTRLSTTDSDARTIYRLSIAGGKVKNGALAWPCVGSTIPPAAWTLGTWEQGRDLELLGAFATLQSQGCWVGVQTCTGGGLCFEVELTLDLGCSVGTDLDEHTESTIVRPDDWYERDQVPEIEEATPDTQRSHGSSAHQAERAMSPVLICDDEARLVALTAGLLREFGFEVLTVRSGAEAIRAVVMHPIDIVILDVNLPGENAQKIVEELRSRSDVSVILSSGYTEEDIDPRLLRDSAVKAFLAKPYGVETLVNTIDRVRLETRKPTVVENPIDQ